MAGSEAQEEVDEFDEENNPTRRAAKEQKLEVSLRLFDSLHRVSLRRIAFDPNTNWRANSSPKVWNRLRLEIFWHPAT